MVYPTCLIYRWQVEEQKRLTPKVHINSCWHYLAMGQLAAQPSSTLRKYKILIILQLTIFLNYFSDYSDCFIRVTDTIGSSKMKWNKIQEMNDGSYCRYGKSLLWHVCIILGFMIIIVRCLFAIGWTLYTHNTLQGGSRALKGGQNLNILYWYKDISGFGDAS